MEAAIGDVNAVGGGDVNEFAGFSADKAVIGTVPAPPESDNQRPSRKILGKKRTFDEMMDKDLGLSVIQDQGSRHVYKLNF